MKLCVLSGGTGTPKLIQGLKKVVNEEDLSIIVNTGEDTFVGDLYLSPDVDTVLYTLSDQINEEKWYGVKDDTYITHELIKKYHNKEQKSFNEELWIGDKDRALKYHKTHYINKGYKLSEIINLERNLFNIKANVYPMTNNNNVKTKILIKENNNNDNYKKILMEFHDFWIKRKGQCEVLDIFYENSNYSKSPSEVINCINNCDGIIIGPSNPITSIGPILAIEDIKHNIINSKKPLIVVSPIVGNNVVSGPAGKFLKAKGYDVNWKGLYKYYYDLGLKIDLLILDNNDKPKNNNNSNNIYLNNTQIIYTNTIMKNMDDKVNLANIIINFIKSKK